MTSSAGLSYASTATAPRSLDTLRTAIDPVRTQLLGHSIYQAVDTLPRLRRFMSQHVFAVWDFMCLAKRLQRDLTSLDTLWLPPARPSLARFINSVVLGEESDIDPDGHAASHFGLYLAAMEEIGADVGPPRAFVELLRQGAGVQAALAEVGATAAVVSFVAQTMRTVEHGTTLEALASFLFGREDLIPDMFTRLLPQWGNARETRRFAYYVQRHIELDGDDHGPAGRRALEEMAGTSAEAWDTATQAAHHAIAARIALWDGVAVDLAEA
jgi:Protein of unknown function (DUF3050)